MDINTFKKIFKTLEKNARTHSAPVDGLKASHQNKPFHILISALISTRTQDKTTAIVCKKLFKKIKSFKELERIDESELERLVYPAGFYRVKARNLKKIARLINNDFGGKLPEEREKLMMLPGVGRKVANLVLSSAFGKNAICVDIHVHRISNRLALVATKKPEETEHELMRLIPKRYWRKLNHILVSFGQRICKPVAPLCEQCPVEKWCPKINV
jgi:endonuclease-3